MKKILFQGSVIIIVFVITIYGFTQINWVKIFQVEQITSDTEVKLGDVLLEMVLKTENEIKTPLVNDAMDSIVSLICVKNDIRKDEIKIHVVRKDEINAFAMPNGHLIVYSGLITNADNQEELIGVLCHEIAHIELNHVMKKLLSEMGLSVLITLTTGNGSPVIIKEVLKKLSSLTYERSLEQEADLKAVDYMIKANINPIPFANFLFKQSLGENETSQYLKWASTHPDSKDRSIYINDYIKNKSIRNKSVLNLKTWESLKIKLTNH